jgi:purine-binding chemotaxis protein CheW
MSQKDDEVNEPILQWVTYQLEDETYGINVMQVQEVLRITEISPVPGSPSYVLGIINLRGNVVTVIDTRSRFGLMPKESNDDQSRIIIVEVNGNVIGMLVDSVAEVVYLHQSEIDSVTMVNNEDSSRFIQGVCSREEQLLVLVDANKFLTEEEVSVFSGFEHNT